MKSRFRRAVADVRRVVVRRLALPLLGTRPLRGGAVWLGRYRFRSGDRLGRAIDRVLIASTPSAAQRAVSVRALVELFFDLCAITHVDVFVEAGAKEASASRRAVKSGIAHVVAFEANPYTHKRFSAKVTKAGVDYRHIALAERAGEATFLVRRREDGTPIPDGQGSLLVRPDHTPGYEHVTVTTVPLDDAVDVDGRVAMWVDVEGAVAEVFGGAPELLRRTDVVIIEVEADRRWIGQQWVAGDVVDHLERAGLRAVGRDMQSRQQFNTLFVRDGLLAEQTITDRITDWRRASSTGDDSSEPSK